MYLAKLYTPGFIFANIKALTPLASIFKRNLNHVEAAVDQTLHFGVISIGSFSFDHYFPFLFDLVWTSY